MKKSKYLLFLENILIIIAIIVFFYNPIISFVIFIITAIIPNKSREKIYKTFEDLPTARIRSVAIGLNEIKGVVVAKEELTAPIKKIKCVGYVYTKSKISYNNGRRTKTCIEKRARCEPFYLKEGDDTILVSGVDIDLIDLPLSNKYKSSGIEYCQYLLQEGMEVFVLGNVTNISGDIIVNKDSQDGLFGLVLSSSYTTYLKRQVVFKPLIRYIVLIIILTQLILLLEITIEGNKLILNF